MNANQAHQFATPKAALAVMFDDRVAGNENSRIAKMRADGFARVISKGLPNRRVEAWKYTDLRAALAAPFPMAAPPLGRDIALADQSSTLFNGFSATRFTIVNGHLQNALSDIRRLPPGVEAVSLTDAFANSHLFPDEMMAVRSSRVDTLVDLNNAFATDGVVIRIAEGAVIRLPLHLQFLNFGFDSLCSVSRVVIVVGAGASVTILESHEGVCDAPYQTNTMVEVVAGDRAKVSHLRLADGRGASPALSTFTAALGHETVVTSVNVAAGAEMSRHQIYIEFKGEHSTASIAGATMLSGRRHGDISLMVDHAAANCKSRELFKTVVDESATGVFQGKIAVRKDSQKTDGKMMSAALLLSDDSTMNNKPELEIFADDVVCGHGATCGQLDDELLFYLMARGLPRRQAEALMVEAFLGEALEMVAHDEAKAAASGFMSMWLDQREARLAVVEAITAG
jgi:Fe-S cluster assembly protein SufD